MSVSTVLTPTKGHPLRLISSRFGISLINAAKAESDVVVLYVTFNVVYFCNPSGENDRSVSALLNTGSKFEGRYTIGGTANVYQSESADLRVADLAVDALLSTSQT